MQTQGSRTYAAWHGPLPMRETIERCTEDRFLVEGEGARVRDRAGRWYLDARAGLWNVTLGYSYGRVIDAMKEQLDRIPFANFVRYERPGAVAIEYANRLAERLSPLPAWIRFANSGSQATESAVMLSRFIRSVDGTPERMDVIALRTSWHGTGPGANALTGESRLHGVYGPLAPRVHHVVPPTVDAEGAAADLERAVRELGPERVTAIIVEPVLGTGGFGLPPAYVDLLNRLGAEHGIHVIADEVTTGLGRTGAYLRSSQIGLRPDIVALGKGLASGYVPLAAVAASDRIYERLYDVPMEDAFGLGSTTDGHPLAMAAGLAVLDALDQDGVLDNVAARGRQLELGLRRLQAETEVVACVRGCGLMWAVELGDQGGTWPFPRLERVRFAAEDAGVLVSTVPGAVMLMPPLIVTGEEVDEILAGLREGIASAATPEPVG